VGGLCDCGSADDSPASLGETAAGWPIFGQFLAHDITADRSTLRSHTNTADLRNARNPQLNLECLYGDGPTGNPFLYQRDDPAKFLLGLDGDLQRNVEGIAATRILSRPASRCVRSPDSQALPVIAIGKPSEQGLEHPG
jgi:hypothetical protein